MQFRVLIAATSCVLGLSGQTGWGAQTLYPIVESHPSPSVPIRSQTTPTNAVPADTNVSIVLKPTAIGPTGASGLAQIKNHTVLLQVRRLEPGQYVVQLVMRPDDSIKPLGTFTIIDPTLGPSRQATDNTKEASANPESVVIKTDVQLKVPVALKPQDVARVLVLGPGDNAVLAGPE
jgi:hypothetical protein